MLCITGHHQGLPRSNFEYSEYIISVQHCTTVPLILWALACSRGDWRPPAMHWGQLSSWCSAPTEDRSKYCFSFFSLCLFLTKTLFVLESKSPVTWNPYFRVRGELQIWVCQIICRTCWWQMLYKHLFSYYSKRQNGWESKSFFIFCKNLS